MRISHFERPRVRVDNGNESEKSDREREKARHGGDTSCERTISTARHLPPSACFACHVARRFSRRRLR